MGPGSASGLQTPPCTFGQCMGRLAGGRTSAGPSCASQRGGVTQGGVGRQDPPLPELRPRLRVGPGPVVFVPGWHWPGAMPSSLEGGIAWSGSSEPDCRAALCHTPVGGGLFHLGRPRCLPRLKGGSSAAPTGFLPTCIARVWLCVLPFWAGPGPWG